LINTQPEGFLAQPSTPNGEGIVVIHAWWGLNDTARSFCQRLAAEGYTVFAPDLYHGKVATTIEQAEALGKVVDANPDAAKAQVDHAIVYLASRLDATHHGLAVMGFSLGAYFALVAASAQPQLVSRVVLFYGTGPADFSRSRAAYLGHFAENDPFESAELVNELESALSGAGRPVTFHRYPGTGHWFFEPDRADAYDAKAAELAWNRTIEFLQPSAA
jgi:carboxymethylenebutenolidase